MLTSDYVLLSLLFSVLLAAVHPLAGKMLFLESATRSHWLSLAGGISVAYVFTHLLPELSEGGTLGEASSPGAVAYLERHVYLIALVGLVTFYGLERAATARKQHADEEDVTSAGVFWLYMVSFFTYNLLIGYLLLHRGNAGLPALLFYSFAMALHFVVNDFGLREHYRRRYDRIGRWVLAAAVPVGWGMGLTVVIGEAVLAVLFAFLWGVVLNVLKEEHPEERESRFLAFALGGLLCSALLLVAG